MIHVHFGFYFAVLGLVVGLSRGVGLPRGGFAIMAGSGLRPACLWGAVSLCVVKIMNTSFVS